jgi:hypothetical protein
MAKRKIQTDTYRDFERMNKMADRALFGTVAFVVLSIAFVIYIFTV